MNKHFFAALAVGAVLIGGAWGGVRADVIGTFTSGGFTSGTFLGAFGQSSIGHSSDGTQQRGIIMAVVAQNSAPTDIALDNNSVAENQPAGTKVGDFSTTDDAGDTHTYTLASGTGDTDNASFSIDGGSLETAASFDYELKSSYSIRVRSTDNGALFHEKAFTITVTNANDAPVLNDTGFLFRQNVSISDVSISGAQLSGSDDDGDTLTYSVTNGTLPAGITLGTDGSFSGTPTARTTSAGVDVTVNVSDGNGGSDTATINLKVQEAYSLIVTHTSDPGEAYDGETSLREAITLANSNPDASVITFDIAGAGPHIVQLDNSLPDLSTPITLTGPTDESVTIRGEGAAGAYRIFTIAASQTVGISYLTISNGAGGITNNGTLNISNSTISGNSTTLSGGGVFNDSLGTLNLSNTTISGNTSGANSGGGIANFGTLNVSYSTLSGNSAGSNGGGIFNNSMSSFALNSSIVAGNSAPNNANVTGMPSGSGNVVDVDAKLAPLANNGGPTQTHALLYGSPAINAGDDATAPATDQRGLPRAVGIASDIGAFEVQAFYTITGYVRTGSLAPVPNVTMQLSLASGPAGATVSTDANGFYAFSGVPAGGYSVAPNKSGWAFTPNSSHLNVTTANRAANFIATRVVGTYSITGRIATSDGNAVAGASVALTPTKGGVFNPVLTNSAGYYTFNGVPDGSYTVTPSKSGWSFAPANRSVTVNGANKSGENFTGMNGHKIIGRAMTSSGVAIAGVTVTRSGVGSTPVTTNSAGYFTFINVPDGNITITPSKSGYIFTPGSKIVMMSGADVSGQNFIGATGYSISGRIATSSGMAIDGVSVQLDDGVSVTTNSAGYYTFTGVANGQHTLTPSKNGFSFVPVQKMVEVNNGNVAQQNFTGSGP